MKPCLYNRLNFSEKTSYGDHMSTDYGTDEDDCYVKSTSYDEYYKTSYNGTCISDYNSILQERWEHIKEVLESAEKDDFVPIPNDESVTNHQFEHNSDYSYTHRTFYW